MRKETEQLRLYPSLFNSRRYYLIMLRKQIEYVIQTYVSKKINSKLFDYGCGVSPYKKLFLPYLNEYISADIETSQYTNLLLLPDGSIPCEGSSYDIALSTQVLEHVEFVTNYLAEVNRILKDDGLFILTTHGYWIFHPDPNDFWRWTSQGLKKLVNEAGFEIVYFRGIIGRSAMGLQLFQDGFIFKLPKFILPIFSFFMQILINIFDKTSSQNAKDKDACTYIVVAKKIIK